MFKFCGIIIRRYFYGRRDRPRRYRCLPTFWVERKHIAQGDCTRKANDVEACKYGKQQVNAAESMHRAYGEPKIGIR